MTLKFPGASLRYVDVRIHEAVVYARMHFMSDLTEAIRNEMEWGDLPASISSGKLTGNIDAHQMKIEPTNGLFKKYELQAPVDKVGDFAFRYAAPKDSEPAVLSLSFVVRASHPGVVALAEQYLRSVGSETGLLAVEFEENGELFGGQNGR